ncbi:MAG TPA: Fic family protein [Candidatus Diapherotrites archaeon]|nr:Fic family protein [Candidatus Diapherotrites archaeon]
MFVEERKTDSGKKYYLVHSYREGKKVKKIREYLGNDLSKTKIHSLKKPAKERIEYKIANIRKIKDPLKNILSKEEIERVKELQKEIKVFHLSKEQWIQFTENFTYNTNAIEGSELDKKEVKEIIEDKIWPKEKSKEDISEAQGVKVAIDFIRNTKEHISIELIKEIHRLVFKNSKPFAGQIRPKGTEVVISNGLGTIVHRGAPSEKIIELLEELVAWYNKYKDKYPPILLAAVVHNLFENIHPFQDGNGRVGRILLNNILLKNKLPPVDITFENRHKYYFCLREYQNNQNIRPTIEILVEEYKTLKKKLKVTTK